MTWARAIASVLVLLAPAFGFGYCVAQTREPCELDCVGEVVETCDGHLVCLLPDGAEYHVICEEE